MLVQIAELLEKHESVTFAFAVRSVEWLCDPYTVDDRRIDACEPVIGDSVPTLWLRPDDWELDPFRLVRNLT